MLRPMHNRNIWPHPRTSTSTLRILTWNIHKGLGGIDRRYDLARTIEVLGHCDPDIILLQEVAEGVPRLRRERQADLIQHALGMHAIFYPEHHYHVGCYGNLIASRWPLYDPIHVDLTVGRRKKRGMIQVHVRSQIDLHQRTIVVNAIHLGLLGVERRRQLERIMACSELTHLRSSAPVIIGGDLNDLWGNLGTRYLLPSGFARAGPLMNTFPSALALRPLDGLFFRGQLKLLHAQVVGSKLARTASDHLPVCADFALLHV